MFSIIFISEEEEGHFNGKITIGDFEEEFESDASYWNKEQYLKHWVDVSREIASGRDAAFITDMRDPNTANFIVWWPAYIQGTQVKIHNQILFLRDLKEAFSEQKPFLSLPPYQSHGDNGQKISEWDIPLAMFSKTV